MKTFIQLLEWVTAASLHADSPYHDLARFDSKQHMNKHFREIKNRFGDEAEAKERSKVDAYVKERLSKFEIDHTHILKHNISANSKGNQADKGTLLRKVNNPLVKDTYTIKSGPNKGKQIKVPESSVEEYKKDK